MQLEIQEQSIEIQEVSDEGAFVVRLVTLDKPNMNGWIWDADVKLSRSHIQISSYDHATMFFFSDEPKPVGAAQVYKEGKYLMAAGHYNLTTQIGQDAHSMMMFMKEHGYRQDWSIGFIPETVDTETINDREYARLTQVSPIEASPVMIGADRGAKLVKVQKMLDMQDIMPQIQTPNQIQTQPEIIAWTPEVYRLIKEVK